MQVLGLVFAEDPAASSITVRRNPSNIVNPSIIVSSSAPLLEKRCVAPKLSFKLDCSTL